jgi:hypothetical protein
MKKFILFAFLLTNTMISCTNTSSQEGEHKHDDGSTHTDHTDTITVKQEEFIADSTLADTTVADKHDESKPHSH